MYLVFTPTSILDRSFTNHFLTRGALDDEQNISTSPDQCGAPPRTVFTIAPPLTTIEFKGADLHRRWNDFRISSPDYDGCTRCSYKLVGGSKLLSNTFSRLIAKFFDNMWNMSGGFV